MSRFGCELIFFFAEFLILLVEVRVRRAGLGWSSIGLGRPRARGRSCVVPRS